MTEKKMNLQERLGTLFSRATQAATEIGESVKVQAEKGKGFIEDKMKEREANEVYKELGREVYALVKDEKLALPDELLELIEAIDDILEGEEEAKEEAKEEDEATIEAAKEKVEEIVEEAKEVAGEVEEVVEAKIEEAQEILNPGDDEEEAIEEEAKEEEEKD